MVSRERLEALRTQAADCEDWRTVDEYDALLACDGWIEVDAEAYGIDDTDYTGDDDFIGDDDWDDCDWDLDDIEFFDCDG